MRIPQPPPRCAVINPDGFMSREWYLFFLNVVSRTDSVEDKQNEPIDISPFIGPFLPLSDSDGGDYYTPVVGPAGVAGSSGKDGVPGQDGQDGEEHIAISTDTIYHSRLWELDLDTHLQYLLLAGRSGGQDVAGNTRFGDGTNYTLFTTDGTQTMAGTARVVHNINLGIDAIGQGSSKPTEQIRGTTRGWSFGIGDNGYIDPFELQYSIDETEDVEIKLHFYCNNSTAARYINFQVDYSAMEEGVDVVPAAGTTLTTGDVLVSTTPYTVQEAVVTIPAAAIMQDEIISLFLERIAAAGTDSASQPVLISMEIEFISNKIGENI